MARSRSATAGLGQTQVAEASSRFFPGEDPRHASGKRIDTEQEILQGLIKLIWRATSPKAAAAFPAGGFWSFLKPTMSIPGWTVPCYHQGCPRLLTCTPKRSLNVQQVPADTQGTSGSGTLLVDRARGQAGICIIPPASTREPCGSYVRFDPAGISHRLTQPSVSHSPFIRDYVTRKLNSNTEHYLNQSLNLAGYTNLF